MPSGKIRTNLKRQWIIKRWTYSRNNQTWSRTL